jgi:hypothetical protein
MTQYWVGCKVRIKVRFEDQAQAFAPPVPSPTAPGSGVESFGAPTLAALASTFVQLGDDIVPETCTLELNNYRKADTFKVSIPLARLPFDPRLIRAMTVQIFGGVFTPAEYAAGQAPDADALYLPDVPSPLTGVPTSFGGVSNELIRGFADKHGIQIGEHVVEIEGRDLTGELLDAEIPPNMLEDLPGFLRLDEAIQLLLTGDALAQTESVDKRFNEQKTRELGRGRRRLLKDARAKDAEAADLAADGNDAGAIAARAEAQALRQQANGLKQSGSALPPASRRFGLPGFRGMRVFNDVQSAPGVPELLPTIDEIRPKQWVDSRGAAKRGRRKSKGNRQKVSYWDFITELVYSAGYIVDVRLPRDPFLTASEIVITNPRNYYRASTTAGDIFPPPTSTRVFVHGGNAEEITFERSLKGTAVPTIQIRGFDTATGIRYSGTWPPLARNGRPSPTGQGDRDEIKVVNLDSITGGSPDAIVSALTRAAASVYEQLSRGDLVVSIRTPVLSALPENLQAGVIGDLFALRPRDPIAVEIPPHDPASGLISTALILAEGGQFEKLEQARLAGLPIDVAAKYAAAASTQYIQREFRTRIVTWTWSVTDGWDAAIQAVNFLDVRDSIQVTETRTGITVPR